MSFRISSIPSESSQQFLNLYQILFPHKKISSQTIKTIFAKEPAGVWFCCNEQDIPMGFLYFWDVGGELQVMDIGTLLQFRNQGVAKTLLQKLMAKARDENKKIVLEVSVENSPAIRLYESLGFQKVRVRSKYYDGKIDALDYVWS